VRIVSAFSIQLEGDRAQISARKRANVSQILFGFGALRMQNSAGLRRVRCATRRTSA
jgi:hypothetical protein